MNGCKRRWRKKKTSSAMLITTPTIPLVKIFLAGGKVCKSRELLVTCVTYSFCLPHSQVTRFLVDPVGFCHASDFFEGTYVGRF